MMKMAQAGGEIVGTLAGMGWPNGCDTAFKRAV